MTKQHLIDRIIKEVNPDNFDFNGELEIFTIEYTNHVINLIIEPLRNSEGILTGASIKHYDTVHKDKGDVENLIDEIELDNILYKHLKGKE